MGWMELGCGRPGFVPSLVFISCVTLSSEALLSEPTSSPLTLGFGGLGKSCPVIDNNLYPLLLSSQVG